MNVTPAQPAVATIVCCDARLLSGVQIDFVRGHDRGVGDETGCAAVVGIVIVTICPGLSVPDGALHLTAAIEQVPCVDVGASNRDAGGNRIDDVTPVATVVPAFVTTIE